MATRRTPHPLFSAPVLLLLGVPLSAQQVRNPGFEELKGPSGASPTSWNVGGQGYEVRLDSLVPHGGSRSLRMQRIEAGRFGVATQTLDAAGFHGQRVRLSGLTKTEEMTGGYAGLWLRIDTAGGLISLENMAGRGAVGTSDWTHFQVEGVVDPATERLVFGALFPGGGTAWFDDPALEAIPLLVGSAAGLDGQGVDHWSYRVQAGYADINHPVAEESGGPILAFGMTREILWNGLFRAGTDFALSEADKGFVFFAGAVEFRHSPAEEFTSFAKMNWGYLSGSGHTGSFVAGTGGFLVRVGARTWILLGVSYGEHGERDGPNSILIGLERGFGISLIDGGSQTAQGNGR